MQRKPMQRKPRPGCAVVFIVSWLVMFGVYYYFGGDRASDMFFLNNTGQKILVIMKDGRTTTVDPDSFEEIRLPTYSSFSIKTEKNEKFNYKWVPFKDLKYKLSYGISNYRIYLQIEPDYKIYILPFRTDRIVKQLPEQPEGYPIEPQKE